MHYSADEVKTVSDIVTQLLIKRDRNDPRKNTRR